MGEVISGVCRNNGEKYEGCTCKACVKSVHGDSSCCNCLRKDNLGFGVDRLKRKGLNRLLLKLSVET